MSPICLGFNILTHLGRVMHIFISKLTIIDSDYGLAPTIYLNHYWNTVDSTLRNTLSEILSEIHTFSFRKMHLKCPLRNCDNFVSDCKCLLTGTKAIMYDFASAGVPPLDSHWLGTSLESALMIQCKRIKHGQILLYTTFCSYTDHGNYFLVCSWKWT